MKNTILRLLFLNLNRVDLFIFNSMIFVIIKSKSVLLVLVSLRGFTAVRNISLSAFPGKSKEGLTTAYLTNTNRLRIKTTFTQDSTIVFMFSFASTISQF